MRFDGNHGAASGWRAGYAGTYAPVPHPEDNDFVQAGALYRVMSEPERARLAENIAASLSQVSRDDIIDRAIGHFTAADPAYGEAVATAVKRARAQE